MIPITVVIVAFGVDSLDLSSVPKRWPIVLVHNDDRLRAEEIRISPDHPIEHLRGHGNVGFGAGANLGLTQVATERVAFCNPDADLVEEHWEALAAGAPGEIVSVPMVDDDGRPAPVMNPYPRPLPLLLTGYRIGRLAARGTALRRVLERLLGRWGTGDAASFVPGRRRLHQAWCSGAIFSVDTARALAIGGFDEGYFMYFEDVDFCLRLADRFGDMIVRVAPLAPARHAVGGSGGRGRARTVVERHLVESAIRYAETAREAGRDGSNLGWRVTIAALRLRSTWLGRR
ncbi:MAG TPA: hypothetical protein VM143_08100 [Acidimicrobiales bacterium]|nr:hypothetical protein [Acidimicrobiales bacterium]